MKIVTSGAPYIDIDGYAGCVAYAELLNLQGEKTVACSTSLMNESITATIRSWKVDFKTDYKSDTDDKFIIIDTSDPNNFDIIVDQSRVIEVIDHHVGFEEYWGNLIGNRSTIDFIGAVCTLIFEKYQSASLLNKMSVNSAKLLVTGILDNTLNFKASITDDRDRNAYNELIKIAELPENWAEQYFIECQNQIFSDINNAINNDTKIVSLKKLNIGDIAFGQLAVWDGQEVINKYLEDIIDSIGKIKDEWFINLVGINEGKSYFICKDSRIQDWAIKLFNVEFNNSTAIVDQLWLRKEIIKKDLTI